MRQSLGYSPIKEAGSHLLPIEAKAEENVKAKSLRQFVTVDNAGSGIRGIRFSMRGYTDQGWMVNVPLFAARSFVARIS